jgi:hypothetical protein
MGIGTTSLISWVIIGLRAAPKEDFGLPSAEMVYGEPLTPPGEFLDGTERPPSRFLQRLRQQMSDFVPPASRPHPPSPLSCRPSLCTSKWGRQAPSLTPIYAGPDKVVERREKYFFVDVGEARRRLSRQTGSSFTRATLPFKQLGQCPPLRGGL